MLPFALEPKVGPDHGQGRNWALPISEALECDLDQAVATK